jgi:hypothetical protein
MVRIIPRNAFAAGTGMVRSQAPDESSFAAYTAVFMSGSHPSRDPFHLGAGVPDPINRSRFTGPFTLGGVAGTWEYRLGDDDRVTMRLVDAKGFQDRVRAKENAARR